VRKKDAKLAAKAQIKVNYLHVVLNDFQKQNYDAQKQLVLVPSNESVDSIRKLQQAAQKNGTAKPGAATAPKK
jgi:L-2-hydroxyglutarate oxidase LhgO